MASPDSDSVPEAFPGITYPIDMAQVERERREAVAQLDRAESDILNDDSPANQLAARHIVESINGNHKLFIIGGALEKFAKDLGEIIEDTYLFSPTEGGDVDPAEQLLNDAEPPGKIARAAQKEYDKLYEHRAPSLEELIRFARRFPMALDTAIMGEQAWAEKALRGYYEEYEPGHTAEMERYYDAMQSLLPLMQKKSRDAIIEGAATHIALGHGAHMREILLQYEEISGQSELYLEQAHTVEDVDFFIDVLKQPALSRGEKINFFPQAAHWPVALQKHLLARGFKLPADAITIALSEPRKDAKELLDFYLAENLDINAPHGHNLLQGLAHEKYSAESLSLAAYAISKGAHFDPDRPELTNRFLKRMAVMVKNSGGFLAGKLSMLDKSDAKFDHYIAAFRQCDYNKLGKRIPRATLSSPEYAPFLEVLRMMLTMAEQHVPQNIPDRDAQVTSLLTDFMSHTSGSWSSVRDSINALGSHQLISAKDAIHNFAVATLLPDIATRTRNRRTLLNYDEITDRMVPEVARFILGERDTLNYLKVTRAWHQHLPQLDKTRKLPRIGEWPALCDSFTASNGLTLVPLTNANELTYEGVALDHCVGTYTAQCMKGTSHIFSVRDEQGNSLSTVELNPTENGLPLTVAQHMGPSDSYIEPGSPNDVALQELLVAIQKERIQIDFSALERERKRLKEANPPTLDSKIGLSLTSDTLIDDQNTMLAAFFDIRHDASYRNDSRGSGKTISFIPGGQKVFAEFHMESAPDRDKSFPVYHPVDNEEFLEKSGLDAVLKAQMKLINEKRVGKQGDFGVV